jgi:hypothetical protein
VIWKRSAPERTSLPISTTSPKPSVVRYEVFAPLRSKMALVATVVACRIWTTSLGSAPAAANPSWIARITPSTALRVVLTLAMVNPWSPRTETSV